MTIVFDAAGGTSTTATTGIDWNHTMTSGNYRIGLVGTSHNAGAVELTAVTWGGVDMTLIDEQATEGTLGRIYYITSPPAGVSNIIVDAATPVALSGISASFTGVEISDPIGTPQKASGSFSSTTQVADTVATEIGWMAVDLMATLVDAVTDYAADGTQTSIGEQGENEGTRSSNAFAGMSYQIATGPSVEMAWDFSTNVTAAIIIAPLKTATIGRVRAIKYFHDINDPGGRILDDIGRVVPPWEIRPNNWIRVTGVFLPTSVKYASFAQDPEIAYIEEVAYSTRGGLRIKTNRGEMTDVLLARAAGGKTL